jgi:hypothetical protein
MEERGRAKFQEFSPKAIDIAGLSWCINPMQNITSFTAGVLLVTKRPSGGGSESRVTPSSSPAKLTSGPPSRNGPSHRGAAAALLELPQKIEGDIWVKHGESKEFYAAAQIGSAIRAFNE